MIDADALREAVKQKGTASELIWCVAEIDRAPTIDAEPVRHGTWETVLYEQSGRLNLYAHACPECKHVYKDFKPIGYNYCNKCGTKMDGGGSDGKND